MELWVTASCEATSQPVHVAPDEDCTCGFYAMRSADDVAEFGIAIDPQVSSPDGEGAEGVVLGRVLLAGKVIEHEYGYRAERARIAALIPTTTDGGITLSLASRLELSVGPTLDTTATLREIEEMFRSIETIMPHPDLIDRWRLRRHLRHFSLIRGGASDDPEAQPPRPFHPLPFNPSGIPRHPRLESGRSAPRWSP